MDKKQTIENLKKMIFEARPIFGKIITKHGKKSLYKYSKEFLSVNVDARLEARRPICLQIVKDEIEKRLGIDVAKGVERQLLSIPLVNTMDHHSIVDHPFWLNANIVTSLPYQDSKEKRKLKYLIVFSFASVSLNNASGFPRGILFHGGDNGEGPMIRLPILPDKWKMRTVYGTPAYTMEDLQRSKTLLAQKEKEGLLSKHRRELIESKIFTQLEDENILKSQDFCEQITKLNYKLWPQYFSGDEEVPNLIYIEAETMTREMMLQEVLTDEGCILYEILFNEKIRNLALKYFDGIPGAFSSKDQSGTYFFWTFDAKGYRVPFLLENNKLIAKDRSFEIDLDAKSIEEALKNKKIFPSTMLVYLFLSLHYGFKCLGGFSQVHDLTKMKEALLHVLVDLGQFREIHSVCRIQTKEFGGDGTILAYVKNKEAELTPATGMDLLIAEKKPSFEEYRTMAKALSLEEMINPMLPEIYTVLYPSYERDSEEEILSPEDIIKTSGLDKKLENFYEG